MAKKTRQIIKIDEEKCNGCGLCVPSCAEGAIQIIDGKAKLVADKYCDGLGACLGECPMGALSFETREAEEFDEEAAMEHVRKTRGDVEPAHAHSHQHAHGAQKPAGFVCPSARMIDRTRESLDEKVSESAEQGQVKTELRQWPVKLYLVNPSASYFENADLLIAADCTAFAYGSIHPDFMKGKTVVTGCPKFDDAEVYLEKLTEIFRQNDIKSVTVLQMEVPCCSGMLRLVQMGAAMSGKRVPVDVVTISLNGEVKSKEAV